MLRCGREEESERLLSAPHAECRHVAFWSVTDVAGARRSRIHVTACARCYGRELCGRAGLEGRRYVVRHDWASCKVPDDDLMVYGADSNLAAR